MESRWMKQETYITTELCSGFQGFGGGANQQAFCNSARMALLASIILDYGLPAQKLFGAKNCHVILV